MQLGGSALASLIAGDDVQQLLRRVVVRPDEALSARFPAQMPARLRVRRRDGTVLRRDKSDREGFATRPWSWALAIEKLESLAAPRASADWRRRLVHAVAHLERIDVAKLASLLREARGGEP